MIVNHRQINDCWLQGILNVKHDTDFLSPILRIRHASDTQHALAAHTGFVYSARISTDCIPCVRIEAAASTILLDAIESMRTYSLKLAIL